MMNWLFFINSILFGIGLAIDAFSISLANGLYEPDMKKNKMCLVAGVFGGFQALMPMLGWFCVRSFLSLTRSFEKYIPWIAFILLLFIGGKMVIEGILKKEGDARTGTGLGLLLVQGIATSIDALSVGFTITDYTLIMALVASLIIAVVTFIICIGGIVIGKKCGMLLKNKAQILGGCVLIGIGIEILVKSFLF